MDTFTNPQPTTHEPVPARDGREAPSRLRVLATSVAVAGLTATGGLAVILSTGATGGSATTAANLGGAPARQVPAAPQASAATGGTTLTPGTTAVSTATASPGATGAPAATAPTPTQSTTNAAQPPQPTQGNGPGHASSGGS